MIRTAFIGVAAVAALSACEKAPETPAPAPAPEVAAAAELPTVNFDNLTLDSAIANLKSGSQHLLWALPPGIQTEGPFTAEVVIKRDGEMAYQQSIPLQAEKPAAASYPSLMADAELLRLGIDETWPSRLKEIQDEIDGIKTKYGPGHGELTISSGFKTTISPDVRQAYCIDKKMPPVRIFLEQAGNPPLLQKLEIGGAEPLLNASILNGCLAPQ